MSDQEWWARRGNSVIGPFTPIQLRELARSGKVGPETMVSMDAMQWFPAGKVRGLLEPADAPVPAAPPPLRGREPPTGRPDRPEPAAAPRAAPPPLGGRVPPTGPPNRPEPVVVRSPAPPPLRTPGTTTGRPDRAAPTVAVGDIPQTGGAHPLRHPILRVCRHTFRYQMVALYETHLLTGTRFRGSLPITEEMCHPEGEAALAALMWRPRRIAYAEIADLREEVPKLAARKGTKTAPNQSQASSFTMRTTDGRSLKVSIPTSQTASVRGLLSSRVADRYRVRRSGILDGLSTTFLVVIGIATCVGWIVTIPLLSLRYLRRKQRVWTPVGEFIEAPAAAPANRRPDGSVSRNPFRSRWVGWPLKILGICYVIAIWSPLTDGLSEFLDKNLKDANSRSIVWTVILMPGPALIFTGYQLCQRRYDPKNTSDTRRPIVFLRPFEDDASTSLQPPGIFAAIAGVRSGSMPYMQWSSAGQAGRTSFGEILYMNHPVRLLRMVLDYAAGTSEESLVRFFEIHGPVIAIGKPGERMATPGADRMYIDDAHWQETVLAELKRCQAVVVQPGSTAGVRWELAQIRAHVEPFRVLLCLVSFWKDPQSYEELEVITRECLRLELPRVVPFLDRPCFLYFEQGWMPRLQELSYKNPILWPLTTDAADLPYTLNPFVQGMHGGEREPPRPPLWRRGVAKSLADAAAVLIAVAILFIPVLTVRLLGQYVVGAFVAASASADERQIAEMVKRSPRITLEGRAVPYRIDVPEALVKHTPDNALMEHWRKSPDNRLSIQVIAHGETEDVANLAQTRLQKNKVDGITDIKLESARTITIGGVEWIESVIVMKVNNEATATETCRATSGPRGTVFIAAHVVGNPTPDPVYSQIVQEVLQSLRFADPPRTPAVAIPAPARNAPRPSVPVAKRVPARRDPGAAAEEVDGKSHVTGDPFYCDLLERASVPILRFQEPREGLGRVCRCLPRTRRLVPRHDKWRRRALETPAQGEAVDVPWNESDSVPVHIEIVRPNLNADEKDREVDYRFRLVRVPNGPQ